MWRSRVVPSRPPSSLGVMPVQAPPSRRICQPAMPVSEGWSQRSVTCASPAAAVRCAGLAGAMAMVKVSVSVSLAAVLASLSVTVYVYCVAACEVVGVPLTVRVASVKVSPVAPRSGARV